MDKNQLRQKAEEIYKSSKDAKDFLKEVQKFVVDYARGISHKTKPKSIIESRFTPAIDAFNKGWLSCGSMVNIGAEMARSAGYKVKLVHGECAKSADHAWIMVQNPNNKKWEQYDLTQPDLKITPSHKIKKIVNSWEEIRDQIEEDHKNYSERRKKLGKSKSD